MVLKRDEDLVRDDDVAWEQPVLVVQQLIPVEEAQPRGQTQDELGRMQFTFKTPFNAFLPPELGVETSVSRPPSTWAGLFVHL